MEKLKFRYANEKDAGLKICLTGRRNGFNLELVEGK